MLPSSALPLVSPLLHVSRDTRLDCEPISTTEWLSSTPGESCRLHLGPATRQVGKCQLMNKQNTELGKDPSLGLQPGRENWF